MNHLNSVLIEGNAVQSPNFHETPEGTEVCTFTVASSRYCESDGGDKEKRVSFFDVESWGNLAKTCAQTVEKGKGVRVVGRLKQDRWHDESGKKCSKIIIVAEYVEFKFEGARESDEQIELNY